MKSKMNPLPLTISLTIGLFSATDVIAATNPAKIAAFTAAQQSRTLHARPKSWRDPAFGDMGWTHHSDWGRFNAEKGSTITIILNSSNAKVHPAVTIWHRGKSDTAPNKYVVDHFYAPNTNQFKLGAKDDTTGEDIGDIVMKNVYFCYDLDGNKTFSGLHGRKDGTAGRLVARFKAPYRGAYMFVLGGINPGSGVDSTKTANIRAKVTGTAPDSPFHSRNRVGCA